MGTIKNVFPQRLSPLSLSALFEFLVNVFCCVWGNLILMKVIEMRKQYKLDLHFLKEISKYENHQKNSVN